MAEFHSLPVYKAAIELEHQFCASTQKAKRQLKYGKVDKIYQEIIDFIVKVAFACDYEGDRLKLIEESLEMMRRIKIQVRIILDLGGMTRNGFAAVVKAEEDVSRQLSGWKNSLTNKNKSKD